MSRRILPPVLWTVLILIACWTPHRQLPMSETGPSLFKTFQVDKLIHASMFAGFSFLWLRAAGPRAWVVVAGSGVALAILTELVQELPIVGRDGNVLDGLADAVGIALGLVVGLRTSRPREVASAT